MTPQDPAPDRPMRADARRNRARVLTAAREAFAAEGAMVPLDEIARRAGVGAGTVYRHFPTKEALFEAVILDQLDQLAVDAKQALSTPDPGEGFFGFLDLLTADAATKKDLAEALIGAGVDLSSATRRSGAALYQALGELLARAQQAGVVRPDLDSADLHALIAGALAAEKHRADPTRPGRLNVLIFEALRPR